MQFLNAIRSNETAQSFLNSPGVNKIKMAHYNLSQMIMAVMIWLDEESTHNPGQTNKQDVIAFVKALGSLAVYYSLIALKYTKTGLTYAANKIDEFVIGCEAAE